MSRFLTTAGEQVAELAERAADEGRLSRGRALFRKGSVSDLTVADGSVTASVRGSNGDEYETTVATAPAPPGIIRQVAQLNEPGNDKSIDDLLVDGVAVCPRDMDLAYGCDCADWEEPCKHVVAVLLALADRVDLDDAVLLTWRGLDLVEPMPSEASDAPSPSRPPSSRRWRRPGRSDAPSGVDPAAETSTPDEPVDRSARLSELEAMLGDTVVRVTPDHTESDGPTEPLEPALAQFLGIDMVLEPLDVSGIEALDPLFAEVQLGPLADLGPELATAIATIVARLDAARG